MDGAAPRIARAALPAGLRAGMVASAAVLLIAALAPRAHAAPTTAPTTALRPAAMAPAAATAGWWTQFDDPVLTALLAPVAPQDAARAQTLARQWVAVRVYHAQWSVVDALLRLARAEQAALMDLPPEAEGREAQLSRVAGQLAQAGRFAADRLARRDQAIEAVAQLAGLPVAALVARIGAPLAEWRLPHLVAEPPTVRVTLSSRTSDQVQRLTTLHACHEAALQADRQALAARQALALAQRRAPGSAAAAADDGDAALAQALPGDAATAQAYQALMLALNQQAIAAGELALAWLDHLEATPAATPAAASHTATRSAGKPPA